MNKKRNLTRKLAVTGALGALTVVLALTRLGLIPWFSGASITILQVPVIIGAIIEGPFVGLGIGAIFGIFALIQAAMTPIGLDAFFVNPLISVLPRLFIGPAAWGVYTLIKRWKHIPAIAAAAFTGSIVNTVFVLGALVLAGAITWEVFGVVFVGNGILEAAASMIIGTAVVSAWLHIGSRKKSRLSEEQE
ncbi:MAG: ECF transporter S component [Spirochaetaceae bacterium]|jgi:uncharacterized membrane protein|nr:ECF transporter S component [Spirochaetaceae bacterium]